MTAVEHPAADRASAYGLESIIVDGNDVEAVYGVARTAVDRARAGDGPSLIEAVTYRHGGHSRADPGKYRPDDEVAAWKARDPIPAYRARLEAARASVRDRARRRSTRSPRPRRRRRRRRGRGAVRTRAGSRRRSLRDRRSRSSDGGLEPWRN